MEPSVAETSSLSVFSPLNSISKSENVEDSHLDSVQNAEAAISTDKLQSSSSMEDVAFSPNEESSKSEGFNPLEPAAPTSSGSSVLVISSESFIADHLNHSSHEEMTTTIDEISQI